MKRRSCPTRSHPGSLFLIVNSWSEGLKWGSWEGGLRREMGGGGQQGALTKDSREERRGEEAGEAPGLKDTEAELSRKYTRSIRLLALDLCGFGFSFC